jgi:type IV fimbrial biogenesis protein FimT
VIGQPRHVPASIRARGFSLVELLVVVAIIIMITALSLPNLVGVMASAKLRGAMGDLSTLLQQCRTRSVQRNKYQFVHLQSSNGRWVAYIDDGANVAGLNSMTPQFWLPNTMSRVAAPTGGSGSPTPLDATSCGGSSGSALCSSTSGCDVYFTPLGIPAQCTSISSCATPTAFAYYFNYTGSLGGTTWAALCVSPAGRLKSWYWNGSSWSN